MSKLIPSLAIMAAMLCLAGAPAAGAQQTGQAPLVQDVRATTGAVVNVPLGKSRVIRFPAAFAQVVLARPATADVRVLSSRSFYVYGKEAGSTNVLLLDQHNQPVAMIDLEVGYDVDGLRSTIAQTLPGQGILVTSVPNGVILNGVANDAASAARAAAIAERFAPGAVTNSLSVRGPQQVLLEVRFLEAQRNVGRELGLNTFVNDGDFQIATGAQSGTGFIGDGLASGRTAFGALHYLDMSGRSLVDVQLDALEQRGSVHMLAEPNLAALSGDTATFLAGGEFPIPVAADNNRVTIEFKQFGVALAFTPTVLADGRINLRVSTEVSQLDQNNGVRVERIQIPSLVVRRSATTIELGNGQSMAMAGLIQSNYSNSRTQTPWVGDVPVLGALFASTRFERAETELVVMVTPRLVAAADSQAQLTAPFHPGAEPNDPALFLGGVSEKPGALAPAADVPPTAQAEPTAQAGPPAQAQNTSDPAPAPHAAETATQPQARGQRDLRRAVLNLFRRHRTRDAASAEAAPAPEAAATPADDAAGAPS